MTEESRSQVIHRDADRPATVPSLVPGPLSRPGSGQADGKRATCLDGLGLLQRRRVASPYLTNFFQHG